MRKRECRSKVTSVTLRPSIYEKLHKIAYVENLTVNSIFNSLAEQYVSTHQIELEEYDNLTTEE